MGKEAFTHSRIVKIERAETAGLCQYFGQVKEGGRMSSERAPVSAFTQAKNTGCSPAQRHKCILRISLQHRQTLDAI